MSNRPLRTALRTCVSPALLAAAMAAACTSGEPAAGGGTGRAGGTVTDLVPTFAVVVAGDSVRFRLRVANDGADAVTLSFASAQRFDFVVRDGSGVEVWRWSADRMFAQAAGEEVVEPGGVLEYGASWAAGEREGEYRAEARLESSDRPFELSTVFELGD